MISPLAGALDLKHRLAAEAIRAGYDRPGSIPATMSYREWCDDLAAKGLKVDRKPFRLDDRPALVPIYDAIPTTREEAAHRTLVIQKATQLGLTVWEVLADIYMALKWGPLNIGLFLPDQATASFKSEHRFMPILRSAPILYRHLVVREDDDGTSKKIGEGNVLTRQVAGSLLMFLWTSGKVSTESRPMDVVSLDEVQEMALDQIDKVQARMGDSLIQFTLMLSTANLPDLDINHWFQLGSQEIWHTECPVCHGLSDLSDPNGIFPGKCIAFNKGQIAGAPEGEYVWTCPLCGGWIPDPQRGQYVVTNKGADQEIRSFLLPRTISPRMTPRLMYQQWARAKTGDQRKSFYNRTLARPYIDVDQIPVTLAHCEACVEEGRRVGVKWKESARETFMGIDQMGGFNAVIIKERLPDGRQAVIHVEAIFDPNPFFLCDLLMKRYGVSVCAVEQLPNVNDARRFANRHRGRVFLANYGGPRADMVSWGDQISTSDRKTAEEDRDRYSVTIQQYKAMQTSLYRIRDKFCLFPPPEEYEQDVVEDGVTKRVMLLRDWVFLHFTKTALVVEQDEETRSPRAKVMKIGLDPHFAFANMLCDVAWARSWGASSFYMPGQEEVSAVSKTAEEISSAMPGLPTGVVQLMAEAPAGSCGRCDAFADGRCSARDLLVAAKDPGCPMFAAREEE